MIMDLNEEELNRLRAKLDVLKSCKELVGLGYEYTEKQFPRLDLYDEYGNETIASMLSTLVGTSIGNGIVCETEEFASKIECTGGILPKYNYYGHKEIVGATINIDNETTRYIHNNNIDISKELKSFANSLDMIGFAEEEINIGTIQAYINYQQGEGIYIIIPFYDIPMEELFAEYIAFLKNLNKVRKDHEKCQKQQ